jgi:hypothetical protein
MQPAAAEIDGRAGIVVDGEGPPAKPRPCLHEKNGNAGFLQAPRRADAGGARPDDCHFDVVVSHLRTGADCLVRIFPFRHRGASRAQPAAT